MRARDITTSPVIIVTPAVPGRADGLARVHRTDEETERVLVALADAVPGVLRARVLTGGQR